jgi:hypothetical protein
MHISFTTFIAPDGSKQYWKSELSSSETESLFTTGISAVTNVLLDIPKSSFLGVIHRSMGVHLYAFISTTGWLYMLGLQPGPYDSDEIARSFFERIQSIVSLVCLNPFYISLGDSRFFAEQITNAVQSHSVMMRFMASSQIIS